MAHYYGTLTGSRGTATRLGTRASGLTVAARSWTGSVTVEMSEGHDGTRVAIRVADGSATGGRLLYGGRLAELLSASTLRPLYRLTDPRPLPEADDEQATA